MFSTLLDRLGNWNPQLLRELKGRLKPCNVILAIALSLISQLTVFGFAWLTLPWDATPRAIAQNSHPSNPYCTGPLLEGSSHYVAPYPCELIPQTHHYAVNWQAWNEDLFIWLSIIMTFALLVIGSYLLLSNLDKEKRRGTLNFIRLSPRSAANVLGGQLIGVPILAYWAIALAIPLQLKTGLGAGLGIPELAGFFGLVGITSLMLYSIALLYGLISFGLGGFQAWLGSGLILGLEIVATQIGLNSSRYLTAFNWLGLFSPLTGLRYLFDNLNSVSSPHLYLFWLYRLDFSGFALLAWANGLLVIGWTWHALRRKFHNPTLPLLQRRYSYLITLCFQGMILGFTLEPGFPNDYWSPGNWTESAFTTVVLLNLPFFLLLIVALSPSWQALQDWSRFRQMSNAKSSRKGLMYDLILGEKSPPLVAFGLNLAIAAICLTLWVMLSPITEKTLALWSILACGGLLMVYACLSQVIMLTRLKRRGVWAAAAIAASLILPMVGLAIFNEVANIGLLAPIVIPWFLLIKGAPFAMPTLFSVLTQWGTAVLLSMASMQQLHRMGKSASQRLFAGSEKMKQLPLQ